MSSKKREVYVSSTLFISLFRSRSLIVSKRFYTYAFNYHYYYLAFLSQFLSFFVAVSLCLSLSYLPPSLSVSLSGYCIWYSQRMANFSVAVNLICCFSLDAIYVLLDKWLEIKEATDHNINFRSEFVFKCLQWVIKFTSIIKILFLLLAMHG